MKKNLSKIHPELRQIANKSPRIDLSRRNLWLIRMMLSLMGAAHIPEDILVENIFFQRGDRTKIRLRIYKTKSNSAPTPVIIWLHGGGFVIGRPEMDDRLCIEFVRALDLSIISVDYRLAPKHPFPTGLEDSYSALKWVASSSNELGVDSRRIAIGGVSAGGGLAAALMQIAQDRQEIKPVFQLMVYPMLDDRTARRTDLDDRNNITWTQKSNRFGWASYLGKDFGAAQPPAYSVPARREDLSGLPPAWIGVGSLDLFHDESVAYANRLAACGIECELVSVPGAFHGFDVFDPEIPIVREFRKSQISALKKHLFP